MVMLKLLSRGLAIFRNQPRFFGRFLYAKSHEYANITGNVAAIGITNYAQQKLGDIVHIDTPSVSSDIQRESTVSAVESVKAVSDIYAPISGHITEINEKLRQSPELVNSDPEGEGWIWKMTIGSEKELADLMNKEQYDQFCIKEENKGSHDKKDS